MSHPESRPFKNYEIERMSHDEALSTVRLMRDELVRLHALKEELLSLRAFMLEHFGERSVLVERIDEVIKTAETRATAELATVAES